MCGRWMGKQKGESGMRERKRGTSSSSSYLRVSNMRADFGDAEGELGSRTRLINHRGGSPMVVNAAGQIFRSS